MTKQASKGLSLRPLKLPVHHRFTLSNGLQLHVVPRGPLPLVAVRLVTRAGGAFDPAGKHGVSDFAMRLGRRGAAGRTADALSEAVEHVGASMGGYSNEENAVVALSTPARHLDAMLDVMGDVALRPDFPEPEVELARRRTLAHLLIELDDPGSLADRALMRSMWGGHPYGHEPAGAKADLEVLSRQDLVDFHRTRLGPAVSSLYVVGDVDPKAVRDSVERVFGGWKGGPAKIDRLPEWTGPAKAGRVVLVDKPEQTQVQVRVGARGIARGHADHFPVVVMNTILGGGFTSRLVTEVRVKRGLSYGVGSSFDMMSGAGTFTVSSFTKTESLEKLLDQAFLEVGKMKKKGPTASEVATVQRYICGLYPGRLETNEGISGSIADVEHYGLPADWIERYRERVNEVTVKSAAEAAAKHLFESERTVVLVGNAEALAKRAEKYGQVERVSPMDLA